MDLVAHLHGLEDANHVAGLNLLSFLDMELFDNSRKGRSDNILTGSGCCSGLGCCRLGCNRSVVAWRHSLDNRLSNLFLFELNGVGYTINLDVCNVVLNVTNIYFVFVTIDFILLFFH